VTYRHEHVDETAAWTLFLLGLILVAVVALFVMSGCTPTQPTTIDDHSITIILPGGPLPSPTPGAGGSGGPVVAVNVNAYGGQECPATIAPSTAQRTVRAGCTQAFTCNPLDAHGAVILDTAVAGPAPEFFGPRSDASGVAVVGQTGNPYNLRVTGVAPGSVFLECDVKGIRSDLTEVKVER
jgi:hypothetical protein